MNTNSFRLGNYVKPISGNFESNKMWNKENEHIFVNNDCVSITAKGLVDIEEKSCVVEFIPINQVRLLKLGFEKTNNFYSFTNDLKFIIEPDMEGIYCLRVKLSKYLSAFICQVNFVHELQNAMFIFRGEDLVFLN